MATLLFQYPVFSHPTIDRVVWSSLGNFSRHCLTSLVPSPAADRGWKRSLAIFSTESTDSTSEHLRQLLPYLWQEGTGHSRLTCSSGANEPRSRTNQIHPHLRDNKGKLTLVQRCLLGSFVLEDVDCLVRVPGCSRQRTCCFRCSLFVVFLYALISRFRHRYGRSSNRVLESKEVC